MVPIMSTMLVLKRAKQDYEPEITLRSTGKAVSKKKKKQASKTKPHA